MKYIDIWKPGQSIDVSLKLLVNTTRNFHAVEASIWTVRNVSFRIWKIKTPTCRWFLVEIIKPALRTKDLKWVKIVQFNLRSKVLEIELCKLS